VSIEPVRIWGTDSGDFVESKVVWSALNALRPATVSPPAVVDLSDLALARPYAIATIAALGTLTQHKAELVLPKTQEARDYVLRCGLLEFFADHHGALASSQRIVPVRCLQKPSPDFADEITRAWEREFDNMPVNLRPVLADHLDEMIRNALSHAESPIGCVVAGQVYPASQTVEIAVLDLGQTVRGHLSKLSAHRDLSDTEAVLVATAEGVTGTPPGELNRLGEPNSGVGLFELRSYCESGGGEVTIVSGQACVTFGREREPIKRSFAGGFPGCLVYMRFRV
jgi:hypothetical protein